MVLAAKQCFGVWGFQFHVRPLKMVSNDLLCPVPIHCTKAELFPQLNFTSWSISWTPTAPPPNSWPPGRSEASENGPKWFPISQNIGFVTRTMSLASSEAELEFHFLKYFLTSFSPSTQFLASRSIWGFWKWSQMIPHIPKPWFCHQNHVPSMLRSWVRISLLEVLLDLLQPLHPVLGLQVDLGLLKMVTNDSPYPKTLGLSPEPCLYHAQKLR